MNQWQADCLRENGRVLTGMFAHYCADWDFLTVDETTAEFEYCSCDWKSEDQNEGVIAAAIRFGSLPHSFVPEETQ